MPTFQYKSVDKSGRPARGNLDATNEVDLELRLKRMGLDLITFRQIQKGDVIFFGKTLNRRDLLTFCFDMEQITQAEIPLLQGLRDLRDSIDNPRFRDIITSLIEDMEGGKTLSQAMLEHPDVFDKVFTGLVKAGEQTGSLPDVFASLAETLKWQDEQIGQTRRLMLYPAFLLLIVFAASAVLITIVVPQVAGLFKTMSIEPPLPMRIVLGLSRFVSYAWPFLVSIPIVAFAITVAVIKNNSKAAYLWDYFKLRLPVIGMVLQKIILARFANFFAMMYKSGISVLDALKTTEEIVDNKVISSSLQRAGQQIMAGESLAESFQNLGLFPPLVLRMLRLGETTGALDRALMHISYFYTRDVKESVDSALRLLGPILTVVVLMLFAIVVLSVMLPMYDILGKIKF